MGDLRLDAELVRSQILAIMGKHPHLAEDAELLADTLEGMTDFNEVMDRLAQSVVEARGLATGLAGVIGNLKSRQQRFDKKADAYLGMAFALLTAAKQTKVVTPTATMWTRQGGSSVVVDDVNELPQGHYRTERVADKEAIRKSIEAGEAVPGARLVETPASISIRTN